MSFLLRVVNGFGVLLFLVTTYASLSLLTQSGTTALPNAGGCTVGREAGALFNPCAVLNASQVDDHRADADVVAEGTDVLMVGWSGSPDDLWNGLIDHTEWYDDQSTDGHGTFYVPVGTVVEVPNGLYLATIDGWAACRDGWWAAECSATGPVVMLDPPAGQSA